MEKTESSVFLRWEPDQFRRLLLRDAETNRAKESFEADSITLKVKVFTYNFDEQNETFLATLNQMDWNYVATIRPGNHEPKTLKLNWAGEVANCLAVFLSYFPFWICHEIPRTK